MAPRRSGASVAARLAAGLSGLPIVFCILSGIVAPTAALDLSAEEKRRILRRLDLSARGRADLVAFLETLTEKKLLHEFVRKAGNAVCR